LSKKVVEIIGEFCVKGSRIGVRNQLQYRQRQDVEILF
jgi:single-stranded DNA-binding protein